MGKMSFLVLRWLFLVSIGDGSTWAVVDEKNGRCLLGGREGGTRELGFELEALNFSTG